MMNLKKPFNPILGETLNGHFSGHPFYLECISHHPPIFALQIYGDGYKNDTIFYPDMQISPNINQISSQDKGHNRVKYKNTG